MLLRVLFLLGPLMATVGHVPAAGAAPLAWVHVGDPGNAANSDGFGAVAVSYRIAETEVTNAQYAAFLNVVDRDGNNVLALYDNMMGLAASGGIERDLLNAPGSRYVVRAGRGAWPVNFVTFDDTLRFANWMNNGEGTGDTETGAYDLASGGSTPVARSPGATVFLLSEQEWYKAAYFDSVTDSYHLFPGDSADPMLCAVPAGGANLANCDFVVGAPVDVGSYPGSAGPSGTFDQGGNVFEWTEGLQGAGLRVYRGGDWESAPVNLSSAARHATDPALAFKSVGFRMGSVIPEPSTGVLVALGCAFLGGRARAGHRRPAG